MTPAVAAAAWIAEAATVAAAPDVPWWQGFWGWLVTTVLAGIGAVGVVIGLAHRRMDRPWVQLAAQIGTSPEPSAWIKVGGPLQRSARITNFGRDAALAVRVFGAGLTVDSPWEGPPWDSIPPGKEWSFTVTVEDDAADEAWFLITWTTARTRHGYQHWAWLPALQEGPLAEVRSAQLRRGLLQRVVARATTPSMPSPGSVPTGVVRTSPTRSARRRARPASPRWPRLRRALWRAARMELPTGWATPPDPRAPSPDA